MYCSGYSRCVPVGQGVDEARGAESMSESVSVTVVDDTCCGGILRLPVAIVDPECSGCWDWTSTSSLGLSIQIMWNFTMGCAFFFLLGHGEFEYEMIIWAWLGVMV